MPENVYDEPQELLHFVSQEHEQFLIAIANERDELRAVNNLQGLYKPALSYIKLTDKADLIVYQLLGFTHYHFLFATACLLRCHLSEAFNSLRSAIDAALVAAYIINDRPSQEAYFARRRPFDKLMRHARNPIREKRLEKLPHPQIPYLIEMYDLCSRFASHADIDSFAHRARQFRDEHGIDWTTTEYFQFSRDPQQQRYYFFSLMHGFAIILDVFSSFLIDEQKKVDEQWRLELHGAIAGIERVREATGPPDEEA
jgi:hypothetical protein